MILMRQRRPEEGHEAVAHHLVHGALVAMDSIHHSLEHGVEDLPCLFGITIGEQLHGPLEIGEQNSDLLPFTFKGAFRREDLFDEMLGDIALS
jgi:hypothetical protein